MSGEYFIPEASGAPAVNVLPTERLQEICQAHNRYAEALIEVATMFLFVGAGPRCAGNTVCGHCTEWVTHGCDDNCPGLLARRALGVAP